MEPPSSQRPPGPVHSSEDLPYGPLPVRAPLDQLVDLSWLALGDEPPPEPAASGDDRGRGPGDLNGPESGAAGASEDADVDATAESSHGADHDVPLA